MVHLYAFRIRVIFFNYLKIPSIQNKKNLIGRQKVLDLESQI